MVDHLRRRPSKGQGGIVAEGHDAGIGNLLREEVFQPKRLRFGVCPGGEGIAAEAVDGHNTVARLRQQTAPDDRMPDLVK